MPHVGDVAHVAHLVAERLQITEQQVEGHGRTRVPQMRIAVDRRPADVHGDLPGLDGFEVHLLAAARIVQLDHKSSFGRSFRMRAIVAQESTLTFATQVDQNKLRPIDRSNSRHSPRRPAGPFHLRNRH